jgi:hypothetical protein
MVHYNCESCRYYFDGYCKRRRIRSESSGFCTYYEPTYELKLTPDGKYGLGAVSAKKHVTYFAKRKRGSTDPVLKQLRKKLNLPRGFHLQKSKSDGSIYVKNATTKERVRTISAKEVVWLLSSE